LQKIGCPPQLLSVIKAFHEDTQSTISFSGSTSSPFQVKSGVKQGCVLAPTLFGIFFSMLLQHAFRDCNEGVYIHTRTDGSLFNIARLRAKTKVRKVLIREMLFADAAALVSHTEDGLQQLVNRLSDACREFGLAISLDKTKVMAQGVSTRPAISIDGSSLEAVEEFPYLGSTVSSSLVLDAELNKRVAKAAVVMARLNSRVWKNPSLTAKTKLRVYQACVFGTLLYGSQSWTTYASQERKLNRFHLRCLRRILRITRQDNVTNTEVLARANMLSMIGFLNERRLR
ncbi:reverse transcriptase domain-containing protein, partial [Acinetobacter baumannii]|uniref:reverse transcriptase domain-containing protein n=1 Tax=Acinetobacter baumannii TaxID=470 RepID=UPI003399BC03